MSAPDPVASTPSTPFGIAVRFGLLGGLLGAAFLVVPPLLANGVGGRLTDYVGMMIALLAVFIGSRALVTAHPGLPYARRVAFATSIVAIASALVGLGLYFLYASWRPELLAERYASHAARVRSSGDPPARVAAELERIDAQQAQYLDPAFQALGTAGTLFFFGMILALYSGWRFEVSRRLALQARAARAAAERELKGRARTGGAGESPGPESSSDRERR